MGRVSRVGLVVLIAAGLSAAGISGPVPPASAADDDVALTATVTGLGRRIDVVAVLEHMDTALPVLVAVDHGHPQDDLRRRAVATPRQGWSAEEHTASFGATPGSHVVSVMAIEWVTTPAQGKAMARTTMHVVESVDLTVTVAETDPAVPHLLRAPGEPVTAMDGGGVRFTERIPVDPATGGCPAAVLEHKDEYDTVWQGVDLAWQVEAATGGCDREVMALGPRNGGLWRLRVTGADGQSSTSLPWDLAEKSLLSPHSLRPALTPSIAIHPVGDILHVDGAGALSILELPNAADRLPNEVDWLPYHHPAGPGWAPYTLYGPGDWDGDGHHDVMAEDVYGALYLYPGDGAGGLGPRVQIGRGWGPYRIVPTGDLTGDRRSDLLAVDVKGSLWLYPGGRGMRFGTPMQVGKGWTGVELHSAGDMNRDGRNDILGVDPSGKLWFYAGRGNGSFAHAVQVGKGWSPVLLSSGADLTGDGVNDLLGRDVHGTLWVYPGRVGGSFGARILMGAGW